MLLSYLSIIHLQHFRQSSRATSGVGSRQPARPRSTPLYNQNGHHHNTDDTENYNPHGYDSLTPTVIYQLANGQIPESLYGERASQQQEDSSTTDSDVFVPNGKDMSTCFLSETFWLFYANLFS